MSDHEIKQLDERIARIENVVVDLAVMQERVINMVDKTDSLTKEVDDLSSKVGELEKKQGIMDDRLSTLWKALGVAVLVMVTLTTGVNLL